MRYRRRRVSRRRVRGRRRGRRLRGSGRFRIGTRF